MEEKQARLLPISKRLKILQVRDHFIRNKQHIPQIIAQGPDPPRGGSAK